MLIDKRSQTAGQVTVDTTRTSLNGFGVFAIIVFAIVSLIVIQPVRIHIPHPIAKVIRSTFRKIWLALAGPPDVDQQEQDAVEAELSAAAHNSDEQKPMYLTIDHVSAPVIGVIVLLATTTIGGEQVRQGIVGEDGIEPYDVLALFISLAYIAISLDATGLLRFLAFLICLKAGRQGREAKGKTLYLLLYFFFWSAGVLVGNDPVILSGTAFLVYFTRVAGISPPDAWIWAEFVAANISSAVLVSSNPTNLVIATGFDVNFITYTAYMVLPAFASAVGGLVAMLLYFRNREQASVKSKDGVDKAAKSTIRKIAESVPVIGTRVQSQPEHSQIRQRSTVALDGNGASGADTSIGEVNKSGTTAGGTTPASETPSTMHITNKAHAKRSQPLIYIPETIIRPDVDPRAALVDKFGAIFGSIVMAATLATLVGTSVVGGVKVYQIAVPGAVLCFVRDAVADWLRWRSLQLERRKRLSDELDVGSAQNRATAADAAKSMTPAQNGEAIELNTMATSISHAATSGRNGVAGDEPKRTPSRTATADQSAPPHSRNPLRRLVRLHSYLNTVFPTVSIVLSRLPFPLLPFAFSMFILVQALAHVGFINILSSGLGRVCSSGYVATAFFISALGIILCNIGGTNIGATILLTKSVRSPYFSARINHLSQRDQELIMKVAQYSIAFGSNVGALGGTFAASLAGLLWLGGLKQGGITVGARQFLKWCAVVVVPSTVIGIAVIIAEVRYFHVSA
ncbi:uncharacterized protein UMAG_01138 [Mycosarcoma maydis]|uniref:Citrate transporter-like domain-containing protein n=1 Tax=Mycosarcoma maydis TaxID=5270 RepID=A0A0D1E5F3_MYCMD|nr:uncharacterized protein UMAG_01138 [Ustilago maydis 521]KIS71234.1 hypothetical protein UMAG_01138 [Ustilago maydis 521]|eukprot:XP_011387087.1 hypothetical protein UMAG_01138 [Ustilago maydis 521]